MSSGSPSNRLTRSQRREETTNRLVEAAAEIALSGGVAAITIEAVAQRAGLTSGAIYSNFASKEELVLAVAQRLSAAMQTQPPVDAADLKDFARRTAEQIKAISAVGMREQLAMALEFYALALRDSKLRDVIVEHQAANAEAPSWFDEWLAARNIDLGAPTVTYGRGLDALTLGLAIQRALYGEATISDDTILWALDRFT